MNSGESITFRPKVGIFRHTLYRPSERFIPDQAKEIRDAQVLMIARDPILSTVAGLETRTLSEQGRAAVLQHTLLGNPGPLERVLGEEGVNIVHAHFGVEGLYAFKAAKRLDVPLITTLHGYDVTVSSWGLAKACRPAWLHYALGRGKFFTGETHFICVSEHIKKLALAQGVREEQCVVIGTGVDSDLIRPCLPPEEPVVLHVARLVEKKGTEYLIRAFKAVRENVPDARLRIVGEGPLRTSLERLSSELGLGESVSFLGPLAHSEVLREIQACTVFSLPSVTAENGDQEGLGQVALEAAATGRPVIATRHGGLQEAVLDGESGLLVDERNVPQLTEAISLVLGDKALARTLGDVGRSRVVKDFDLRKQAGKVEQFYRQVAGDRS